MNMKPLIAIGTLCLLGALHMEQALADIRVDYPKQVPLNEVLNVTVILINQGGGGNLNLRSKGLRVLPSTRQSSRIEIVGNKVLKEVTYTYALRPIKEGQARFEVWMQQELIGEYTVNVTPKTTQKKAPSPSVRSPQPTPSPPPNNPFGFRSQHYKTLSEEDVFIRNIPSKKRAYVGEPFTIRTVLFYKVGIESPQQIRAEEFSGLSVEIIDDNSYQHEGTSNVNGHAYNTYILIKRLVYAHYAGSLNITGGEYTVSESSFFFTRRHAFRLLAPDVRLDIMPLVDDSLQNRVGDFRIKQDRLPKTMITHTPLTLKITLSGTGNFKTLEMPELALNYPNVMVKPSSPKSDFRIQNNTYTGKKSIEYYLIPQEPMTLRIPALSYRTFSPSQKKVVTLKLPPQIVHVTPNPKTPNASLPSVSKGSDSQRPLTNYRFFPIHNESLPSAYPHMFYSPLFLGAHAMGLLIIMPLAIRSLSRRLFTRTPTLIHVFKEHTQPLIHRPSSEFAKGMQEALFDVIRNLYSLKNADMSTYQIKQTLEERHAPEESFLLLDKIHDYQSILFSPHKHSLDHEKEYQACYRLLKSLLAVKAPSKTP